MYICTSKEIKIMALQKQNRALTNSSVAVHRKEAFDIGYKQYFKDIANNRISQILNSKERNVKFENITYRQLNSWEKEGLLTNEREERSWRRFSIMDALWVKVIFELREFGMGWEQIKNTKYSLEYDSKEFGVQMPILEFYTAFAIGNKMPVLLLVFKDGVCVPANLTQYKVAREFSEVENHLLIDLNAILQEFFPNVDLKPKHKHEIPVSVNEMELLAYLRIGDFEKITVKFNGGEMEKFEGVQRLKAKQRIEEIIREHKYQDIQLKVEDGGVTAIFKTIKKKFTKGSNLK